MAKFLNHAEESFTKIFHLDLPIKKKGIESIPVFGLEIEVAPFAKAAGSLLPEAKAFAHR
jgi:hypothetical protein